MVTYAYNSTNGEAEENIVSWILTITQPSLIVEFQAREKCHIKNKYG